MTHGCGHLAMSLSVPSDFDAVRPPSPSVQAGSVEGSRPDGPWTSGGAQDGLVYWRASDYPQMAGVLASLSPVDLLATLPRPAPGEFGDYAFPWPFSPLAYAVRPWVMMEWGLNRLVGQADPFALIPEFAREYHRSSMFFSDLVVEEQLRLAQRKHLFLVDNANQWIRRCQRIHRWRVEVQAAAGDLRPEGIPGMYDYVDEVCG